MIVELTSSSPENSIFPESVKQALGQLGIAPDVFDEEYIAQISSNAGPMTHVQLADELGYDYKTLRRYATSGLIDLPDSGEYFDSAQNGNQALYYTAEKVFVLRCLVRVVEETPTLSALAQELGVSRKYLNSIAQPFIDEKPELVLSIKKGNARSLPSRELVEILRAEIDKTARTENDVISNATLAKELNTTAATLERLAASYPQFSEGGSSQKKSRTFVTTHYTDEFANQLRTDFLSIEPPKEGEMSNTATAKVLGVAPQTLEILADKYIAASKDLAPARRNARGHVHYYYTKELQDLLQEEVDQLPIADIEQKTCNDFASEQNLPATSVYKVARELNNQNPGLLVVRRHRKTGIKNFFLTPAIEAKLVEKFEKDWNRAQKVEQDKLEKEQITDEMHSFFENIATSEDLEPSDFRSLVSLFGAERAVDILYKFRPEYHKLPVEYVKSSLAEYLGDFLTTKGEFSLGTLEKAASFLSDTSFQDSLLEIIKSDCLRTINAILLEGVTYISFDTVKGYLDEVREGASEFSTPELEFVLNEVEAYYDLLFQNIHKPDHFVDQLDIDRLFPDINQRINVQEIAFKRRMLISDEMGTGKTASVIMAKEMLGVKQAVVIVPGNVIEVWQDHLVDYFKDGQAPRVLTVDSADCLLHVDGNDYDYILISQERLNDDYTEQLLGLQFDMLIVDEIHKLKNLMTGKRSLNLLQLAERVESEDSYLALLSGTPIPNKISDVAIILKLLYPEEFKEVPNKQLVRMIIDGDALELRSLLLPRMQAKILAETVKMPELQEHIHILNLSPEEQQVYELLMDEDELTANEKMQLLSQFVMNAKMLDATPDIPSTKIAAIGEKLQEVFSRKDKIVMFVNKYIEDVIRGEHSIFSELNLPPDVQIVTIEGNIPKAQRLEIQRRLRNESGKILLVVSGQTADVGVDFSAAQAVFMYNQPWTLYDEEQQKRRVYRPGLKEDMEYHVFITAGTIEDGIYRYIEAKHNSIEKILRGIPVSEIEKSILLAAEKSDQPNLEFNSELAEYYFSSWDKMMKIYAYVKEIGEPDFKKFLAQYGTIYAEAYSNLVGARSYQANASRLAGTLIDNAVDLKKQDPSKVSILDVASGPEMLKRHISVRLSNQVTSIDINQAHFSDPASGKVVAGSLLDLPIVDESVDYANMSLSWHYTSFIPSKKNFERVQALQELNRVLRPGGRAVITMIHSLELRDYDQLSTAAAILGFKVVDDSSGWVSSGSNFHGQVICLEKVAKSPTDTKQVVGRLSKEQLNGIKFTKTGTSLRDVRKIATSYQLGDLALTAHLNQDDQEALNEEARVTGLMNGIVTEFGSIASIPKAKLYETNLSRIWNGRRYILFKKLEVGSGAVVIR